MERSEVGGKYLSQSGRIPLENFGGKILYFSN